MAEYKKMKTLDKVEGVEVFWSSTEFRRYSIEVKDRMGDFKNIYQNQKPTIKELREYKRDLA